MPGEQRRRGHGEYLAPAISGDQPGQRRESHPVSRLVADPALAALCEQLTAAGASYPGTDLVLRYGVRSHPGPA